MSAEERRLKDEVRKARRYLRLIAADDTDPCATHESEALRRQRTAIEALAALNPEPQTNGPKRGPRHSDGSCANCRHPTFHQPACPFFRTDTRGGQG